MVCENEVRPVGATACIATPEIVEPTDADGNTCCECRRAPAEGAGLDTCARCEQRVRDLLAL